MIYSYYPGCTLKNKAQELDRCARLSAQALGITLEELPEWQCCGGAYSMATDEIASKLACVRALKDARTRGHDLVTLCSACHNVIKQTNHAMAEDADFALRANNYMAPEAEYHGETKVIHYLEMLRDTVGFDKLAQKVTHPLTGKRIAAYYGCLLLRPGKVMQMDDPENPRILEDFIRALGASPVLYPYRNECCGGYATLEDKALAQKKSDTVMTSAREAEADCIITACPLCQYNLMKNTPEAGRLPVIYFTELLAQALGVDEEAKRA
ncbi:MAG: CoB--CoM heterodisulfide reductase iron-sulfur subunit B family protein [Eubacteriales bacterium]|nr:CoB--CoM heterodisulfide reductase iron-sulfur subunit B family protein [Eubacteriales bacterium]